MRVPKWLYLSPFVLVAVSRAVAQPPLPELKFTDPAGFFRSALYPPADFSSQEVNASVQVYQFHAMPGDLQQAFARTLFRDLIDPRYRESSVANVKLDMIAIPGARTVLRARFNEIVVGLARERLRLAVVTDGAVAIVDAQAISLTSWQHVLPQLNAFAATLHVVAGTPEPTFPAPSSSAGRAVAGLYMGFARKYMTDLQRGAGYGYYTNALQFYLFSADGRVYRHYDDLKVPGNDPVRFDFDAAERADPVNSGRYSVRGDSIFLRLGPPDHREVVGTRFSGGTIWIAKTSYTRQ